MVKINEHKTQIVSVSPSIYCITYVFSIIIVVLSKFIRLQSGPDLPDSR